MTCKTKYEEKSKDGREYGEAGVWSRFRGVILEVEKEVCRTRRIREGMRRKGSEWGSEDIRRVVE